MSQLLYFIQNVGSNAVRKNMASNDLSNSVSSVTEDNELLCDDVLPYGWYRFLAYGM